MTAPSTKITTITHAILADPIITGPSEPSKILKPVSAFGSFTETTPGIAYVQMGDFGILILNITNFEAITAGTMIPFATNFEARVEGGLGTVACMTVATTKCSRATVVSHYGLNLLFNEDVPAGSRIFGTVTWFDRRYPIEN